MKNILLTSVGNSGILVRTFQKVMKGYGIDAKVYACDTYQCNSSTSMVYDGSFAVPRLTSEDYMQALQSICLGNNVKVVIPTAEKELPIMSANKDIFAKLGIRILVPDYDFVMKCIDNHQFDGYFETLGIDIRNLQDIDNYETLVDGIFTKVEFAEYIYMQERKDYAGN